MPVLDRNDHREPRSAILAADAWTALGDDLDHTWSALLDGRSAVAPVRGFDASGFGDPQAAQIWTEAAEPEDDPARRILGRHGQLIDAVLKRIHETAGVDALPRDRVGLYVCTGLSDTPLGDLVPAVEAARDGEGRFDLGRFFAGAYRRLHPLWPLATLQNVALGQTSIDLGIRGDNVVLSSEGDGSVRALTEAAFALADGVVDQVLAGGGSDSVSAIHLGRLRLRDDLGQGPATPGSPTGDGCSPGEAAAAIVLAREAALSGRTPLAFVGGGATAFERAGDRPGATEDAFRRAIAGALDAARIEGSDVDAVFLHAEGRAGQDTAEVRALAALTETSGRRPRLVATKGALGHTRGAAPVVDVALAVRTLETGLLPPTVTRGDVIEELRGRLVDSPVEGTFRRILILAAGSHGGAGALVLEAAS